MPTMPARKFWVASLPFAAFLVAACNFDFDAYDPRVASSQIATGAGGIGGTSTSQATSSAEIATSGSAGDAGAGGLSGGGMGVGGDGSVQACTQKYGAVPGFVLCSATASNCTFNADVMVTGGNCSGACQQGGGTCTGAFGNTSPDYCVVTGMKTCDAVGTLNDICVCTL